MTMCEKSPYAWISLKVTCSKGFDSGGGPSGLKAITAGPGLNGHQLNAAYAETFLEHSCLLDFKQDPYAERLTGIICTIGPASKSPEMLEQLIEKGMTIARLNFSHGTHEYHAETIANVRQAAESYGSKRKIVYPLAIALDTKGPEIRTGLLEGGGSAEVELTMGAKFRLTIDPEKKETGTQEEVFVDYDNILRVIKVDDKIFVDDGLILLRATEIGSNYIDTEVENGGTLGSKKGINLPGVPVDLPSISDQDKSDLEFGVEQKVDMVFASFIRNAAALKDIRNVLGPEGKGILVIPKIECQQGMDNIDEIIRASDGIMVARGDLGIEIPAEKVFLAQKMIIARCNKVGKPAICATQMLESMTYKPRATRAECTDVANAVLDGADCVMLSGESAKGAYPLECVTNMSNIAKEAEQAVYQRQCFPNLDSLALPVLEPPHALAIATVMVSNKISATAIIVLTTSGRSAHLLARYRPRCPIIAVTRDQMIARQMQLYRGLLPVLYITPPLDDFEAEMKACLQFGILYGKMRGFLNNGDPLVVVSGYQPGAGFTNTMRIMFAAPPFVDA